ncbi:MAG: hypothetical protein K0Q99_866 [Clostridia bacterium]|nr:hypothetical protein [Clostridia bacterium]
MNQISIYERFVHKAIEEVKEMMNNCGDFEEEQNTCKSSANVQLQMEVGRSSYLDTVKMLVNFLDNKDEYTKRHCERVTKHAVSIGRALDLNDVDLFNLEFASLLHDIGKLAVPDQILNKEGKLTTKEYEIVKLHPIAGYDIIKDISFLEVSRDILLQHHERIDGTGYPLGLNDEKIDIKSKILAVADAYDAMTNSRPYRKDGLSMEQAICQLEHCRGSQFDENIVDTFIGLLKSGDAA